MTATTPEGQRATIRRLLDDRSPADALAAYYALHHSPSRTAVFVHRRADGTAGGMLVRAQTGQDLFRPLVTFRAEGEAEAVALFRQGLVAGRPYYLIAPLDLAGYVNKHLSVTEAQVHCLYRLDPADFRPIINIFVTSARGADGLPRYEIRSEQRVHASAGVNWKSPTWAEIYVFVDPAVRGRGWGKSVVSACASALLGEKLKVLYVVAEDNIASIRTAEAVGFRDTGVREYVCQAVREDEG